MRNSSVNSVLVLGRVPPPYGGVTKSVANLIIALEGKGIFVGCMAWGDIFRGFTQRYDVCHVHFSKPYKQLLGILIGRLVARKTILTLHGNIYNSNHILNRMSLALLDGLIMVNKDIYEKNKNEWRHKAKNVICMVPYFIEGIRTNDLCEAPIFDRVPGKTYLLLYACRKSKVNGMDVYGVEFILNNIKRLCDEYVIIFSDPSGEYAKDVREIQDAVVVYFDHPVDFQLLIKQTDIYIRPTVTDGNSLAVLEAIMIGKQIVASDVVTRPEGVLVYHSMDFPDFLKTLDQARRSSSYKNWTPPSIDEYLYYCEGL